MKKLLSLSLVVLFISTRTWAQSGSEDRARNASIPDQFIGAWRLAWLEEEGAGGRVHRADCAGMLVSTRDGHMSVQVMYRNPPGENNTAPVQYAQGGYEASFGTYEINGVHTFTFHVEGALVRTLIGKDLKRIYELSGKQLIVKSSNPNEHWRVAWERY